MSPLLMLYGAFRTLLLHSFLSCQVRLWIMNSVPEGGVHEPEPFFKSLTKSPNVRPYLRQAPKFSEGWMLSYLSAKNPRSHCSASAFRS